MSSEKGLISIFDAATLGASGGLLCREYAKVKADYDLIFAHSTQNQLLFERAAKELNIPFNASDKWVLIKQHLIDCEFAKTVDVAARDLGIKYNNTEKRVRILSLLWEERYINQVDASLQDVIEKWGFSIGMYDPTMQMLTLLYALSLGAGQVEARKAAGDVKAYTLENWKKNHPEFHLLYRSALDASVLKLEDRLMEIAGGAQKESDSVAAIKLLLERSERAKLGELYDALDPEGRKRELKKRAFVFAAEKGANLKEALKLEDPDEYGGLDDVTINLPNEIMGHINDSSPTNILLQMRAMIEEQKNNPPHK